MSQGRHRVVIVGGGFGGVRATRALARTDVDITIVDRTNHHLFQPLLYQVATAALATSEIAWPIRYLLRGRKEVTTLFANVSGVDAAGKRFGAQRRRQHGETFVRRTTDRVGHVDPGLQHRQRDLFRIGEEFEIPLAVAEVTAGLVPVERIGDREAGIGLRDGTKVRQGVHRIRTIRVCPGLSNTEIGLFRITGVIGRKSGSRC